MRLHIDHSTSFEYVVPASFALLQLRLRPQTNACQSVVDWQLELEGATHQAGFADEHGNLVDLVEVIPGAGKVTVRVRGGVETSDTSGVVGPHSLCMPLWFYLRQTPLTRPGKLIASLASDLAADDNIKDVSRLHGLSRAIGERVAYTTGATGIGTQAEDAMATGVGVCQDHAHVFISTARLLGIPARYVSGYLMMNDRVEQEASHAWAEAYLDDLGWVGFDVSNSISPDERYVQVARGLDYRSAAPTTGFVVGAEQENLIVSLQVQQ